MGFMKKEISCLLQVNVNHVVMLSLVFLFFFEAEVAITNLYKINSKKLNDISLYLFQVLWRLFRNYKIYISFSLQGKGKLELLNYWFKLTYLTIKYFGFMAYQFFVYNNLYTRSKINKSTHRRIQVKKLCAV